MPSHPTLLPRPAGLLGAAGLALAVLASPAAAGDIKNPGPEVHIWLGNGTLNWQTATNWNTGSVPGHDDTAILNGGLTNPFLTADSEVLSSLFVSGGVAVFNNGHELDATGTLGTTTIAGNLTRIVVSAVPSGDPGFRAELLDIVSHGRLHLTNGLARVSDRLTMGDGASIFGRGRLEIHSNSPAAFSGIGGESVTVSDGDLTIAVTGGGAIGLPGQVNLNTPGVTLGIEGPLFSEVRDVNMGQDTTLAFSHPWTLGGDLVADSGSMVITGGAAAPMTVSASGVVRVEAGELVIEPPAAFQAGSTAEVEQDASLTIEADGSTAQAGSQISVDIGGTLRFGGVQDFGDLWAGDIELTAATLELAHPFITRMNGNIQFNSFAGLRPRIEGPGTLQLTGDLVAPGGGGVIANTLNLSSGGTIDLGNGNTLLRVEGALTHMTGGSIIGAGTVRIEDGGTYRYTHPATLMTDILNAGTVRVEGGLDDLATAQWTTDYAQEPTGTLFIEIGGPSLSDHDRIVTTGAATLAGGVEVVLVGGYQPEVNDIFVVFEAAGGITGGFESVTGAPGFEAETIGDIVVLTFVGNPTCTADFTGDGVLNFFDVQAFLQAYNTADPSADFTGDGLFNFFDVQAFLTLYGAGCP